MRTAKRRARPRSGTTRARPDLRRAGRPPHARPRRPHLTQGPRENGQRPAIDPLFRSAGGARGGHCIGVVLSGLLDDGASGLRFIKTHGGTAVVQDPEDCGFPSMPLAAMRLIQVDRVARAAEIADTLCSLLDTLIEPTRSPVTDDAANAANADRVELEDPTDAAALLEGPPSGLTCPECGGALWEQEDGAEARFTCHVGHAYSIASLAEEKGRGSRPHDAGHRLPVADLGDAIARSFGGSTQTIEETVMAINRRGQSFECHVRVMPLATRRGEIYASIILATPLSAA